MNPTDTPETDTAWAAHQICPTDDGADPWALASKLECERNDLLKVMDKIAGQILTEEMDDHTAECADYDEGYNACVRIARAAVCPKNNLEQQPEPNSHE